MPPKPQRSRVERKFVGKQTVNTIIKCVYFRKAASIISSPVASLFPSFCSVLCVCEKDHSDGNWKTFVIHSLSLYLRCTKMLCSVQDLWFAPFIFFPSSTDVTVWLHRRRASHTSIALHLKTTTQKKRSVDAQSESWAASLSAVLLANKQLNK